jgi:hypothetical protein
MGYLGTFLSTFCKSTICTMYYDSSSFFYQGPRGVSREVSGQGRFLKKLFYVLFKQKSELKKTKTFFDRFFT